MYSRNPILFYFQDFESELQRGEQLVAARQMTMEVGESEHIHGRITALR